MLQAGRSRPDQVTDFFFNLPNLSSRPEVYSASNRNYYMRFINKARPARRADNLTVTCDMTVYKRGILDISQPYRHPGSVTGIFLYLFFILLYFIFTFNLCS
jgi:hypothetical protein